jgi:eukaryotic-like serine/threonine-protein kinase
MNPDPSPMQPQWLSPQLPREGRYVLGPLLGKGGMGEVLEAWDVVLCRTVALKALKDMDPAAMIRFMHEAQIQARVVHPNICRIYDIESSDGTLKIAMQLIKGPNLEQAAKHMSVDEGVGVLCQVAEAVHAAHRVNLIHRDLKPSNIILERSPEGRWVPYLCDFGLAVSMGEPAMTMSHAVLGTPAFMAPEQTRGDRDAITPATDVYALGGTLHFALLGYPPGQIGRTTSPHRGPKPGLPRDLDTIIRKCLEDDPARRYHSAAALAEDLWRFRNGEAIHARPRRRWARFQISLPRRGQRLLLAVSAAALATLAAAILLALSLRALRRDDALATAVLMETEEAVTEFRAQEALPVHDLRPAKARVEERVEVLKGWIRSAGADGQAVGWYAVGRCYTLLGEFDRAVPALEKAQALAFQGSPLPLSMAAAEVGRTCWDPSPDKSPAPLPETAHGTGQNLWLEALTNFSRRDFATAATVARLAAEASPALHEPAGLEAAALCALARQRYRAGDMAGTQARYLEAMESTRKRLAQWGSNEALRHGYARACLGLAEVQLERGLPVTALLDEVAAQTRAALTLDPDAPDLKEDWLAARFLVARDLAAQGRDPRPGLEEALAFLSVQVKEPAPANLRALGMLIHWQAAEANLQHGVDPSPALIEALRAAGPTSTFNRNYLGEVLAFQARLEAGRGQDPRPTLDASLAKLQGSGGWAPLETAAELWFIKAQWEDAKAVAGTGALAQVKVLADQALRIYPEAPVASALKALALSLEIKRDPARKALLQPAAKELLRPPPASRAAARLVLALPHDAPNKS